MNIGDQTISLTNLRDIETFENRGSWSAYCPRKAFTASFRPAPRGTASGARSASC